MNCPRCQKPLPEASFHLDACEDIPDRNLLQVIASHGACGYTGYVLMSPESFMEVPS